MNYPALLNIIQEEITFYNIYIYVEKNPTYSEMSKPIPKTLQYCCRNVKSMLLDVDLWLIELKCLKIST